MKTHQRKFHLQCISALFNFCASRHEIFGDLSVSRTSDSQVVGHAQRVLFAMLPFLAVPGDI